MLDSIVTPTGFMLLFTFFIVGAVGSLCIQNNDTAASIWGSLWASLGSLWGVVFAVITITSGQNLFFSIGNGVFPLLDFSFQIDLVSAFFIFIISLIAFFCSIYGIGYVKHFYKKYSLGNLGFFYNLFIVGMLLVVSVANGIFFLVAWEMMSIASYCLVIYDRHNETSIKAGFLYLVMTNIGTAFIIIAFLLAYRYTGSFNFAEIKTSATLIPLAMKNTILALALVGFGTKAGIIPFHIWLPAAHPAAPSHISALMSGVMIKTGIFMMIRFFLDLFQPIPTWWGLVLLLVGAVSALLGVLYALTEHNLKRLLAYHSIENVGIILLGLGSALVFSSIGQSALALLGLAAALFHTLNHATFKSLLFLSAGSVLNEVHTSNIEDYGGLIKYMPLTAASFLVGSMAISALPPFNGFFSEWLTFQSLFSGITTLDFAAQWVFILAAVSLAFTGGLALACFVKAFGATFLARPRSTAVLRAKEASWSLRIGMGALAILCLGFGVFSGRLTFILEKVGRDLDLLHRAGTAGLTTAGPGLTAAGGFAQVSGPAIFLFFVIAIFIVGVVIRLVVNRKQKIEIGATWDCGTDLTPRMEITATGFARSIVQIFKGVLKPSIQHEIEYSDSDSRYITKSRSVVLGIHDVYQSYLYRPLQKFISAMSQWVQSIQSGNINAYISYIFVALVIGLIYVL